MPKLVRDLIPARLARKGIPFESRAMAPSEFRVALRDKMREEVDEFLRADDPASHLEEAADVLELMLADLGLEGFSLADLLAAAETKKLKRGAFAGRVLLSI